MVFLVFLLERLIKYLLVIRFMRKPVPAPESFPAVTVLQPILSGDPTLWHCLATNLTCKTHLHTEFIWLLDDNDTAGITGCQELIARFPEKNIRLVLLPPPARHVNPKTFKLLQGLTLAQHNLVAVLDDDTMLPAFGLEKAIGYLQKPEAGIVFGLPYYVNFANVWSGLVSCFVNSNSLFTYLPYTFISEPVTINGMFYVLQKSVFQAVTRNSGFENALTDDYALAQLVKQRGYRLVQTPVCHAISTQVGDFRHYLRLLKRWFVFPQVSVMQSGRWGEQAVFVGFVLLPVFFPLGLVVGMLLDFNFLTTCLTGTYLLTNLNFLLSFNRHFFRQATPWRYYWGLVLQPVVLPFYVLLAVLSPRQINWRGHTMQVSKNGNFTFLKRREN